MNLSRAVRCFLDELNGWALSAPERTVIGQWRRVGVGAAGTDSVLPEEDARWPKGRPLLAVWLLFSAASPRSLWRIEWIGAINPDGPVLVGEGSPNSAFTRFRSRLWSIAVIAWLRCFCRF
ncbi:MAG: hypothetical protein U1G07_23705 [Verrucomicrobiota bacterium]